METKLETVDHSLEDSDIAPEPRTVHMKSDNDERPGPEEPAIYTCIRQRAATSKPVDADRHAKS